MELILNSVIADPREHRAVFERLINSSHKEYIDINTSIPWELGVQKNQFPKKVDHMWLYGTPYFDQLSDEQKLEMAWLEVARDASFFIHFEQIIPLTYAAYINRYKEQMDDKVYEYLMIFSREELTHIMMFHRYLQVANLPWYPLPEGYDQLASKLPDMAPEVGILYTLLIEWTAENAVVASVEKGGVDPLTHELWVEHHKEEVRHIAFGKRIGEEFFARGNPDHVRMIQIQLRSLVGQLHYVYNFNPGIAQYLSFDLPFDVNDARIVHEIRTSEHNRKLNQERFSSINKWCTKLGIL